MLFRAILRAIRRNYDETYRFNLSLFRSALKLIFKIIEIFLNLKLAFFKIYAILQIETKNKKGKLKMTIEEKIKFAKKSTSPEALDKLSNDEYVGVRCGVACNKKTPTKTLEKLADEKVGDKA